MDLEKLAPIVFAVVFAVLALALLADIWRMQRRRAEQLRGSLDETSCEEVARLFWQALIAALDDRVFFVGYAPKRARYDRYTIFVNAKASTEHEQPGVIISVEFDDSGAVMLKSSVIPVEWAPNTRDWAAALKETLHLVDQYRWRLQGNHRTA